jgi:hypothetical protein
VTVLLIMVIISERFSVLGTAPALTLVVMACWPARAASANKSWGDQLKGVTTDVFLVTKSSHLYKVDRGKECSIFYDGYQNYITIVLS